MGIIYFAIVICVLVCVHELGHFLAARFFGIAVKEFSIGVGPKIFGFERKGTKYMLCLLPLGGYVMMAQTKEEAGHETPLPLARLWKQAVVAFAGPAFSLLFAVPCYLAVGLGMSSTPAPIVAHITAEDSPAAMAGLHPGDEISAINGHPIRYWKEVQDTVLDSRGETLVLSIKRGEETLEISAKPKDRDGVPMLGISFVPVDAEGKALIDEVVMRDFPFEERLPFAFQNSVREPWRVGSRVVGMIGGMFTGQVSSKQLGGPIMIFNAASDAGRAGWERFLLLMGVITVNLGLLNLLPIPILDGGRLVLIGIESVQRRPLSMRTQQIASTVGMAMVVGLMMLAFKNDIERYWDSFSLWLGV